MQLEPRYHSSGEAKQEQGTITTLKIPWGDELEGWVLGTHGSSCHSRAHELLGQQMCSESCVHTPITCFRVREDLLFAGKPGKVLAPFQPHPPVLQADLKSVPTAHGALGEAQEGFTFVIPTHEYPTKAEKLKRDRFPEVAKVQEIINS